MIGSWAATKVTFAPVRFSNSARTVLKFFCSSPVQTAATSRLSPLSLGRVTVSPLALALLVPPFYFLSLLPPPHAVRASATTTAAAAACAALGDLRFCAALRDLCVE
jgi:hypothetical protein